MLQLSDCAHALLGTGQPFRPDLEIEHSTFHSEEELPTRCSQLAEGSHSLATMATNTDSGSSQLPSLWVEAGYYCLGGQG